MGINGRQVRLGLDVRGRMMPQWLLVGVFLVFFTWLAFSDNGLLAHILCLFIRGLLFIGQSLAHVFKKLLCFSRYVSYSSTSAGSY